MPVLKESKKRKELRKSLYQRLQVGEDVSTVIKDFRSVMSMEQQAFADYCGLSVSALRKIEQKQNN